LSTVEPTVAFVADARPRSLCTCLAHSSTRPARPQAMVTDGDVRHDVFDRRVDLDPGAEAW
jgi:hypothetical protein